MLAKTYQHHDIEQRWYAETEQSGAFACGRRDGASPYTIVIPPPNVTGSLHMGHALNNTLQDVLIRWRRMQGRDVLWQPGTDHAGIATQMVVERQLSDEGRSRHDLGRDNFIARVWRWREESGGTIMRQLRRLGASADWSRERFTMDNGLSKAVTRVFVDLYREGLIYRDKRLVNWDCRLRTAISDLEVENRLEKGHLWYFRYPIEGDEGPSITVATTRPETMLGDTAVAVHPEDDHYRHLIGSDVMLPIANRRIPVIADTYSDPEKGSGAVKITPAHDFNDFEVGRRHDLELINVFDAEARINENAPQEYRGLDRFDARQRIVARMDSLGLLDRVEAEEHSVPYGDRSGVPVEPWLTDQWFLDASVLAGPAIAAVEDGRTRFVPEQWANTYFEWMRNIQPWCISRQIWWGHQIPAWYGPDGEIFVAGNEAEADALAAAHYGEPVALQRDSDVLDTWFSSALWPFSTLGWPEETTELVRYYPTDVLVTGFDIIFFWVARMMMMGLHFRKQVPFHTVYIHALVRDEKGQKMSKSKGNVLDPLTLMDKYGADALRFTLAAMAAQGRDIKLAEKRIEGYRNFMTKLWNAARFCEINRCAYGSDFDPYACRAAVNRWIVGETLKACQDVTEALEAYRFNEASHVLYQFAWGTFCDWYLEFSKPSLSGEDESAGTETRATAAWVLDQILLLLHPIAPFVSEELWSHLNDQRESLLIDAAWPEHPANAVDDAATAELAWVIKLVSEIRSARAELNVSPGALIPLLYKGADAETLRRLEAHADIIVTLARLERVAPAKGDSVIGTVQLEIGECTFLLPLEGVIDFAAEAERLRRNIAKFNNDISSIDRKLANTNFIERAPSHVVDQQREKRIEIAESRARTEAALARLSNTPSS